MNRKHFVVRVDTEFEDAMRELRYKLNEKFDGEVLKRCVFYNK